MEYAKYSCSSAGKQPPKHSHGCIIALIRCEKHTHLILARKTALIKSFDLFMVFIKLATYFGSQALVRCCLSFLHSMFQASFSERVSYHSSLTLWLEGCRNSTRCVHIWWASCVHVVVFVYCMQLEGYSTSFPVHICPFIYTKHIKQKHQFKK